MKHKKTFLGIGWKFPPEFEREKKSVTLVSEEVDIRESLFILFSTRPGERMMQPEYGCDLSFLNFEPINAGLIGLVEDRVQQSIIHFEPRIKLEDIRIDSNRVLDGVLDILIEYTIITTNTRNNIVFPYYIIEGTDVTDMPL